MSDSIESKGKTVDEAVSEALLQMGARKDEVEITVLDEPRSGLFGFIGNRQAKVLVTRKQRGGKRGGSSRRRGSRGQGRPKQESQRAQRERSQDRRGRDGRDGRGRSKQGPSSSKQGERSPSQKAAKPQKQARDDRGGQTQKKKGQSQAASGNKRRDSSRRGDQSRRPVEQNKGGRGSQSGSNRPPSPRSQAAAVTEVETVILPAVKVAEKVKVIRDVPEDKVASMLEQLASHIMNGCGFPCRCEVEQGEYKKIRIVTDDESAGVLIGRHGSTIDAYEHLIERIASQAAGQRVRMNLDINNYRRRREETLVSRTVELIDKVKETGKEVRLETMNARERRIIHMEVAEHQGVRTFTASSYSGKHVIIGVDDGKKDAAQPPKKPQPETDSTDIDELKKDVFPALDDDVSSQEEKTEDF